MTRVAPRKNFRPPTLYARFDLPPGATYEALHRRYLELAQAAHNKGNYDPSFTLVTEAWAVLKDKMKRQLYDAKLKLDGGNCGVCKGSGLRYRFRAGDVLCSNCEGTGRK